MLKIITVVTGFLRENCYIVHNDKDALIIDPGDDSNKIISSVGNLNVLGILITHYHFDHIGALDEIKNKYSKAKIIDFESKKEQNIGDFNFKIIENFGHTMDSVSYYFEKEKMLFCGDFVFRDSIGNHEEEDTPIMIDSLREFKKLDRDIKVYPGHGDYTSVGYEIDHNIFMKGI